MRTGIRPVHTLLVANRGEIAGRVFRTARALGMTTVAVYSDPDAEAPFLDTADLAVPLRGTTSAETYLDVGKILAAATATGADAVHPGYGFLAENAGFARAVIDAGLVWVGPPPSAIATMGDKLTALEAMVAAGVPTLPRAELGTGDGDHLLTAGDDVGYPLLVKASAGGGGKGMRVVADRSGLVEAVAAARRESLKAFGSDVVYLERYVSGGRHIEIQVMADRHGNVHHLFERECSIQRRHQKVVEEAPSPFLDARTRAAMCDAAVAAAAAVGYEGAGTVEFIVDSDGSFSFLEMNTRLQVEHPVTELVTGVDLVEQQLMVAQGHPLELGGVALHGHAIEARLYAEDVEAGFLPSSGPVHTWMPPDDVRIDGGVRGGTEVSVHYDPMLAKVVAGGSTREEAAGRLARALRELRVHGLTTNRRFLVDVLENPAFLAGDTTTDFIERVAPAGPAPSPADVRLAAVAAALASRERRVGDRRLLTAPPGWRNNRSAGETTRYGTASGEVEISFWEDRDGGVSGSAAGTDFRARVRRWAEPWLDVEIDGIRRRLTVVAHADDVWVQDALHEVHLREEPRFPRPEPVAVRGGLVAPMNGTVVTVPVAAGDEVAAGDTLVLIEAMKMEHRVTAPDDGVVSEVLVAPGDSVESDQLVVVVDPVGAGEQAEVAS